MKYLLITHNAHNLGDVAIAEATIQHIRSIDQKADITLETNDIALSQRYFPGLALIPRHFATTGIQITGNMHSWSFARRNVGMLSKIARKAVSLQIASVIKAPGRMPLLLREAAKADVVLSIAGDSITERYAFYLRFMEIDTITRVNKNLVMYAQSIGPFSVPWVRRWARRSLSKCKIILARDQKTVSLLQEYGVTAPMQLTADSAISLEPLPSRRAKQATKRLRIDEKTIGLVIRTHALSTVQDQEYQAYLQKMANLVRLAQKHKYRVLAIASIPEDRKAAEAFIKKFSLSQVDTFGLYDNLPSETKHILSQMAFVVSPRMHPVILATSVLTPAIALVQEFKLASYMDNIGLGECCLPIDDIPEEELAQKVIALIRNRPLYVRKIRKHIDTMRGLSRSNAQFIDDLIRRQ